MSLAAAVAPLVAEGAPGHQAAAALLAAGGTANHDIASAVHDAAYAPYLRRQRAQARAARRPSRRCPLPLLSLLLPAAAAAVAEPSKALTPIHENPPRQVLELKRDEALALPEGLDFSAIGMLSSEDREKLSAARPATLAHAQRIAGVTPAALVALYRHLKRRPRAAGGGGEGPL